MSGMKKKILVSDDETHITTLYQAVLGIEGFEVIVTQDGKDAVDRAEKLKPDLIILDVKLPSMTGWDACRKIRENPETKDIPVIIASAFGQKDDKKKSFDAGANDFLNKPFDSKTLLERVRKLV